MSFTTGDVDIKLKSVSITSEKNVTIDDICNEAVAISKKLRAKKIKPGDFDAADLFMSDMRKEHKEFAQSYPIVLRYMCQMQQYHTGALRKYLNYIREHPWKNQKEYLESQVHYVITLYKETHRRWNRTQVENLAKNVRNMLTQEHDRFIELSTKYKAEVDHEETGYKAGREESMKAFYATQGKDIGDLHLRTVTDVPTDNIVDISTMLTDEDVETGMASASELLK